MDDHVIAVAVGLASASDTLGSQSFGGKNKFLVGLALQKGMEADVPFHH